jgi:two-component system sensor histidine kinase ChiS
MTDRGRYWPKERADPSAMQQAAPELLTLQQDLVRRLCVAAVILTLTAVLGAYAMSGFLQAAAQNALREDLNPLRVEMQQVVSRDIQLIRGMLGYVRTNPDLTQAEFEAIANDILEGAADHVRNLALARDLIISHIHPLKGNIGALGLNYRDTPLQWDVVERVVKEERIIMAGPINLAQGGTGLIARFPIHHRIATPSERRLWGIASTVIDFEAFLKNVGALDLKETLNLALVGRDGDPDSTEVIWGNPDIQRSDPIELVVVLGSEGAWRLLASPREGWPGPLSSLPWFGLGAILLFCVFAFWSIALHRFARERVISNRVLISALEQAQAASAAKSSFMAVMSHELRTPLNAIIGFSELLETSPRSSRIWDNAEQYLVDIKQSGQFLLDIINDILDLSRIESGRYELYPERYDLTGAIHQVCRRFNQPLSEKEMSLELPPQDMTFEVFGDRRSTQQILINLMTNSLKYAGRGAKVAVVLAELEGDRVEIRVEDNGSGVPKAKLDQIMEPFVQGSSSYARSAGGTGLGLAICRSLARAMDGDFEIESDAGQGLTARLILPRHFIVHS